MTSIPDQAGPPSRLRLKEDDIKKAKDLLDKRDGIVARISSLDGNRDGNGYISINVYAKKPNCSDCNYIVADGIQTQLRDMVYNELGNMLKDVTRSLGLVKLIEQGSISASAAKRPAKIYLRILDTTKRDLVKAAEEVSSKSNGTMSRLFSEVVNEAEDRIRDLLIAELMGYAQKKNDELRELGIVPDSLENLIKKLR